MLTTPKNSAIDTQAIKDLLAYFKRQDSFYYSLSDKYKEIFGVVPTISQYAELLTQHALCAHLLYKIAPETGKKLAISSPIFQFLENYLKNLEENPLTGKALVQYIDSLKKTRGARRENLLKNAFREIVLFFDKFCPTFYLPETQEVIVARYALDWVIALQGSSFATIETDALFPTFSDKLIHLASSQSVRRMAFYNTTSLVCYYAAILWYPTVKTLWLDSLQKAHWNPYQQGKLFDKQSPFEQLLDAQNRQKIALISGYLSIEWLAWALKRVMEEGIVVGFSESKMDIPDNIPIEEVRELRLETMYVYFFKKSSSAKKSISFLVASPPQLIQLEDIQFVEKTVLSSTISAPDQLRWEEIFTHTFQGIELENERWLIDNDPTALSEKVTQFIGIYREELAKTTCLFESSAVSPISIKWTATMKTLLLKKYDLAFYPEKIIHIALKPFQLAFLYADAVLLNYPVEMWLGTDLQQPNLFIIHHPQETWISDGLVHRKFLKEAILIPQFLYDKENRAVPAISKEVVNTFLEYYRPKIQAEKEQLFSQHAVELAVIKAQVDYLIKLSKNLPVLHKYTLKIFNLLPRKTEGSLSPAKAIEIFQVLEEYDAKIQSIGKGAKERQKLFVQLKEAIALFQEKLQKIISIEQEAQHKLAAIDAENIFYYIFGMLFFHREKCKNVLPLEENYAAIVEKSKKVVSLILSLSSAKSSSVTNQPLATSLSEVLKNIPQDAWIPRLAGKPVLKWWLEAVKKYQIEETILIEKLAQVVDKLLTLHSITQTQQHQLDQKGL